MISNNAQSINFLLNDIPMATIAAFFQKDPQVLLAHPGSPLRSIAAMKGRPIMISADTRETWWRFLKLKFGFDDAQIRPVLRDDLFEVLDVVVSKRQRRCVVCGNDCWNTACRLPFGPGGWE